MATATASAQAFLTDQEGAKREGDEPLTGEQLAQLQGLSLQEFLALPEVKPALEYAEGRVTQKVAPQGQHSLLQGSLTEAINRITRPARLTLAFPELRFSGRRRAEVPDVAVYRWERIPRTPGGRVANRFTEPPDIAIEILSPGQSRRELREMCLGFVARGVRAVLLVDADRDAVTLFRPGQEPATLRGTDAVDLDDVIPGLRLTVETVLGALRID